MLAVAVGVLLDARGRSGGAMTSRIIAKSSLVCAVLMLNLRYWFLRNPSGPATTIAPTRVGALDVAVVVDLDALRLLGQLEELGQLAQGARLGAGFGQAPVERFGGVARSPAPSAAAGRRAAAR